MTSTVVQQTFKFDVFISYSRKDGAFASKLEAALRRYSPPKDLSVPQRRLSVFRDQEDIAGGELSEALESGLHASAKLLVLCSPDSRASPYVYKEIEVFGRLRGRDHIIPILVRGIPNNEAKPGQEGELAFSDALLALLSTPLASDYRGFGAKNKANRGPYESAWYQTLTDIYADYSVTRAQVEQRERRRRTRTLRAWVSGLAAIAFGMGVLAAYAWHQRGVAEKQRDVALGRQLAAQSEMARKESPDLLSRSLLLAAEAVAQSPIPLLEADQALREAIHHSPRLLRYWKLDGKITAMALSPDGKKLALAQGKKLALREPTDGRQITAVPDAEGEISELQFTADSRRVLALTKLQAGVWDVVSGKPACEAMATREGVGAISPDGRLLVTAPQQEHIQVWRLDGCSPVVELTVLPHANFAIRQVRFSPDSRYVAASNLENVALWQVGAWDNDLVPKANGEPRWTTYAFAFRPDSARMLVATPRGLRAIELREAGAVEVPTGVNTSIGNSVSLIYAPDGKWATTFGSNGGTVFTMSEDDTGATPDGNSFSLGSPVHSLAFSPDVGQIAAVADGTVGLWSLAAGKEIARLVEPATAVSLAYAADGTTLLTAGEDGTVRAWEPSALQDVVEPCSFAPEAFALDRGNRFALYRCGSKVWRGHLQGGKLEGDRMDDLEAVRLAPGGQRFASATGSTVTIWDAGTLQSIATLTHTGPIDWQVLEDRVQGRGHQPQSYVSQLKSVGDGITVAGLSADGRYIATIRADDIMRIWDVSTRRELARIPATFDVAYLSVGIGDVADGVWAAFSADDRYAALIDQAERDTGTAPKSNLHLFALGDGKELPPLAHPAGTRRAVFSPTGRYLATSGNDAIVRLWELADRKLILQLPEQGTEPRLLFSVDGRYFTTGSAEGDVHLVDLGAQTEITLQPTPGKPSDPLAFDAQSARLAVASGSSVLLYETARGHRLTELPHAAHVQAADFSPDGHYLATTVGDQRTFVWDLGEGVEAARLQGSRDVSVVRFADQGNYLATNIDLRRWRTKDLAQEACTRVAADLTRTQWHTYLGEKLPRACGQLATPVSANATRDAPAGARSNKPDAQSATASEAQR